MEVLLLDYSPFGNEHDYRSDRLLQASLQSSAIPTRLELLAPDKIPAIHEDLVWLRYDVRSPADLHWVVELAGHLENDGHTVFPSSESIQKAEDKWETWLAFERHHVQSPITFPSSKLEQCGYPAIIKQRVGWGGKGNTILKEPTQTEEIKAKLNDCFICQRFFSHQRTLIAAIAGEKGICCLEDWGEAPFNGIPSVEHPHGTNERMNLIEFPPTTLDLALLSLRAVGSHTGTVDLLETPDGFTVLEVNLSPRIFHSSLPDIDLATPMAEAVLACGKRS